MAENVKQIQTYDGVIHDIEDETARNGLNNTYTKAEADALLATKVDSSEVYDKATLNSILDSKADEANVYSKTEADALLADKANAADVYTKAEADAALALKADAADVYTISQTDGLLAAKASIDDSTTTSTAATWSADKLHTDFQGKADSSDVYTKAEVDALIGGAKMKTYFTKVDMNNTKVATVDISSLNLTSADDYFVIINGGDCADYSGSTYNAGANWNLYIDDKTSTSFTIKAQGSGLINWRADLHISCQVVYN